jgi:hypothetical protein
MCFSAAASFSAAALLLPAGLEAMRRCRRRGRADLRPLALLPFGFGLQQALEGLVWSSLGATAKATDPAAPGPWLMPLALAYLFFAYGFWPAWIPWCAFRAARGRVEPALHDALRALVGIGILMGLALWLPLLADPAPATPVPVGHSLHYGAVDLLAGTPLAGAGPFLYLLLIAVPLLLVPEKGLRWFGASLAVSCVLAYVWWSQTFSSVWCFFSALLALQILWILRLEPSAEVPRQITV